MTKVFKFRLKTYIVILPTKTTWNNNREQAIEYQLFTTKLILSNHLTHWNTINYSPVMRLLTCRDI